MINKKGCSMTTKKVNSEGVIARDTLNLTRRNLTKVEYEPKDITDYSDLELCVKYQETNNSIYYGEVIRRYKLSVYKIANRLFRTMPVEQLGLELDDIKAECFIQLRKAMLYIDKAKVTNLCFNIILKSYCYAYKGNILSSLKTKETSKYSLNKGGIYFGHDCDTIATKATIIDNMVQLDIYHDFINSLSDIEKKVFKSLATSYTTKSSIDELKSMKINVKYIKRKLKERFARLQVQHGY